MAKPDILVDDRGSVFLLTPVTQLAKEWVKEHLNLEGWQWLGDAFAVEHRFVAALVDGMKSDGLKVVA
jgi:hypothetical protein